jgi:hypothetical protein
MEMHVVIRKCGTVECHRSGGEVDTLDASDPFAILRIMRSSVEFEVGLTPFHLMRALRPWDGALSACAWIDFDPWLRAMEGPLLKVAVADDERLSGIEIHPSVNVRRMAKGGKREAKFTIDWRTLGRYASPVASSGGRVDETCSVSFMDPREIGHLPISIIDKPSVMEIGSPRGTKGVFREGADIDWTFSCVPTFFDSVVLGFLDDISFHGNPEETQATRNGLVAAVESLTEVPS